jgi:hypothetical protein
VLRVVVRRGAYVELAPARVGSGGVRALRIDMQHALDQVDQELA